MKILFLILTLASVVIVKIDLPPPSPVAVQGVDEARGYDSARLLMLHHIKR